MPVTGSPVVPSTDKLEIAIIAAALEMATIDATKTSEHKRVDELSKNFARAYEAITDAVLAGHKKLADRYSS